MRTFVLTVCLGITMALPQQRRPGSPKVGKGFGSSKAETLPMEVLEKNEEFNVIHIPATHWACIKMELNNSDPFENWREKFDGDGRTAMMANKDSRPESAMFKKLYRYIVGVNSENVEIKMTRPVTSKIHHLDNDMHTKEMCFWLGSPWHKKEPPMPIDKEVQVKKSEDAEFFVKRFGGWALSHKDWTEPKDQLMTTLKERKDVDMSGDYFTIGYDSPWAQGERRNEVWVSKKTMTEKSQDESYETVSYNVLNTTEDYELREYPAESWVCTDMTGVDPSADPMNGWEEKYDNNPYAAMASQDWKKQPSSKMFNRLFKYIAGVNDGYVEIDMTTPVTMVHTPTENDMENNEMCFWLGDKYQSEEPPKPLSKDVKITKIPTKKYFVSKFDGFKMSYDDFHEPYLALKNLLIKENKSIEMDMWTQVSYNSPFTPKNRRNEVWIQNL